MKPTICLVLASCLLIVEHVSGHGRLIDPVSRSSAWRFGFKTPVNYNDHELYCGGYPNQIRNGMKCGVCGDPWQGPRNHEFPDGKYGKNPVIVRTYQSGQVMKATVQITVNHRGYFEFRICPATSKTSEVTEECLMKNTLKLAGSGATKYVLPDHERRSYSVDLQLPKGLKCDRCVFRWDYTAGNNWGRCPDGSSKTGCGPQETFHGCADISIV